MVILHATTNSTARKRWKTRIQRHIHNLDVQQWVVRQPKGSRGRYSKKVTLIQRRSCSEDRKKEKVKEFFLAEERKLKDIGAAPGTKASGDVFEKTTFSDSNW